ncbi:DUF4446 family protein [Paenibacillus spongiae]|uniref:DUF4446 family protein n=1 Tax=Paenibacillus spongiae TaxID=2909671 RepID=A0ABY5S9C6_9BACL|nr:DUF4446 family protein [Paenibacillus spongiae]UVI30319.1 DUF4446 family protein [Paenibacillus spongiae]
MEQIELRPMDLVTIALLLVTLLLLIRTFVLGGKLKRLRKSYNRFMSGTEIEDLEHVIVELKERLHDQEQNQLQLKETIDQLVRALHAKKGNIGIHRYNPFTNSGSNLSFSLAIVNDGEDGLVLSGLHSRDQTYIYAKPVKKGESEYALTEEERKAISLASQRE